MANPMGEIADVVYSRCGTELLSTPLAWIGAIAACGKFLPAAFALIVFLLSYMKLISGSFNPFIYFQF